MSTKLPRLDLYTKTSVLKRLPRHNLPERAGKSVLISFSWHEFYSHTSHTKLHRNATAFKSHLCRIWYSYWTPLGWLKCFFLNTSWQGRSINQLLKRSRLTDLRQGFQNGRLVAFCNNPYLYRWQTINRLYISRKRGRLRKRYKSHSTNILFTFRIFCFYAVNNCSTFSIANFIYLSIKKTIIAGYYLSVFLKIIISPLIIFTRLHSDSVISPLRETLRQTFHSWRITEYIKRSECPLLLC